MNFRTALLGLAAFGLSLSAHAQPRKTTPRGTSPAPAPSYQSTSPAYSFASNTMHEVVITPSRISIESYKTNKGRTDINIYGAYNHQLNPNMQVGGEGGLVSSTDASGDGKTLLAAMGVFTFNFDANLRESFFVQGAAGLYPAYVKNDSDIFQSKVSLFVGGGKRFEVWGKLNYMPYARIWKRGEEQARLEIQALNFSIFY